MDNRILGLTYVLQLEKGVTDILSNHPFGNLIAKCLIAWSASCEVGDIITYKEPNPINRIRICMKANAKWLFEGNESTMKRCWQQNGVSKFMYPDKNFDDFRDSIIGNKEESTKFKHTLIDYITHFDFKQQDKPTKDKKRANKYPKIVLLCSIIFASILVAGILLFLAQRKDNHIGQYVYVDAIGVVHIDRECCFSTDNSKTKEECLLAKQGVEFVDTTDFHGCAHDDNYGYWYVKTDYDYCPRCISDDTYTDLHRILTSNREKLNSQNDEQHRSK